MPLCTTQYYSAVLQSTSLNYRVPLCTTEYYPVSQSITLYYTVLRCTTEYYSVLQSTIEDASSKQKRQSWAEITEKEAEAEAKLRVALQPLAMCRQQSRVAKDLSHCTYYACSDCKKSLPTHKLIQFVWNSEGLPVKTWQRDLGALLQSTTLYYTILFYTTQYYRALWRTTFFALQRIIVYYIVLLCTTEYSSVLQSSTLHYTVLLCSTYKVLVCKPEYYSVVQGTSLYYRESTCNTE